MEELRQLWKSSSRSSRAELNLIFLSPEDDGLERRARTPSALKRWDSEQLLRATHTPTDRTYEHECTCARRAAATRHGGISLLHEVDAQYSALQAKYEKLLQRCLREEEQEQEEEEEEEGTSQTTTAEEDHQPEYKKIFKQIFSHIQKSKKDLGARGGASGADTQPR